MDKKDAERVVREFLQAIKLDFARYEERKKEVWAEYNKLYEQFKLKKDLFEELSKRRPLKNEKELIAFTGFLRSKDHIEKIEQWKSRAEALGVGLNELTLAVELLDREGELRDPGHEALFNYLVEKAARRIKNAYVKEHAFPIIQRDILRQKGSVMGGVQSGESRKKENQERDARILNAYLKLRESGRPRATAIRILCDKKTYLNSKRDPLTTRQLSNIISKNLP